MKKLKLFLETSAISSLSQPNEPERESDMKALWELIKQGVYDVIVSDTVILELNDTKDISKKGYLMDQIEQIPHETVLVADEIKLLARYMIELGIIPESSYNDSEHLACSLITNCDCLVSYNFKHLNKIRVIAAVQKLAIKLGYNVINIVEANKLIEKGEEDEY